MKQKSKQLPFPRITIIGVGLIGGSLALAIKRRFPTTHIIGSDKPAVLKRAQQRNVIDEGITSITRAVANTDLIILATPVSSILSLIPQISSCSSPETIVTDVGSVKQTITELADMFFPNGNFIGGHPMTGSEFSGIDAAHPLLFQNAVYLLTPTKKTNKQHFTRLSQFLKILDTRVMQLPAAEHDSTIAALSHLPQLAAVALMNTAGSKHRTASKRLALGAGGFRDMTRIASSPYTFWDDILKLNQQEIRKSLNLYIKVLSSYEHSLSSHPAALEKEFQTSRRLRTSIPRSMKGFLSPLVDISVYVDDNPGQLARLTGALAKAKINIKDLELLKVREHRGGTFRLSFDSHRVAEQAKHVLHRAGFEVGS
ncbi:MAG TPA: prephenate dehydrogenase [Bacteroidota bacterium]|nr:prephenate dehydrogenase [Bacteroidota bacterium]